MMHNFDLNNPPHSGDMSPNLDLELGHSTLYTNDDVTLLSHEEFLLSVNRSRGYQTRLLVPYTEVRASWHNYYTTSLQEHSNIVYQISGQRQGREIKDDDIPESSHQRLRTSSLTVLEYSCPICREELIEETTTKCGHVFCRKCIEEALVYKKKCPVCRKNVRIKDIFRIYLESNS